MATGNGLDQLGRESGQCSDNGVLHGLRSPIRHLRGDVPLTDGLALAVFPECFHVPVALSLAAQYFQVPIHQVFLIDPAVERSPASHLLGVWLCGYSILPQGTYELFIYLNCCT